MRPDVTFLIAAFNAADTLPRAVASALGQTGVSVEVVIVDDASSDDTAAVAEAFGDARVKLVRLARNGGPGAARNAGLAMATGRFVAVLDADDAVHPGRMERLLARVEAEGAAAAVDNIEVVAEASRMAEPMFRARDLGALPELSLPDFVLGNRLFRTGFNFGYLKPVFRTEFLRERAVRYPEDIRIGEDYLFLASVLAKGGRCVVEPSIGYTYHVRGNSISRVLTSRHVRDMLAADIRFLNEHDLDARARRAYRTRTRSLDEAAAFLSVIDSLKSRAPVAALGQAFRNPLAMRHFRMPVAVRLRRWLTMTRAVDPGPSETGRSHKVAGR